MNRSNDPAQAIIEAAQRFDTPSTAATTRAWSAVQQRWAAGDHGPPLLEDSPVGSPGAESTSGLAKAWFVIGGVVVAAAVTIGVASSGGQDDGEPPQVATADAPSITAESDEVTPEPDVPADTREQPSQPAPIAHPPVADDPAPSSADVDPPPHRTPKSPARKTAEAAKERGPAPTTKTPATKDPKPSSDDPGLGLGDEVAIIAEARNALASGDAKRALALLETHRKRFPRGALMQERELSRVTALCALHRTEAATAAATTFLAAHPSGALRRRIENTCVGTLKPDAP